MKNFLNKCMLMALTGTLTLLGFGSCKTTKISKKQRQLQEQAYLDSLEAAQQKAYRDAYIADSLRQEEIRRNAQKTVYGGPNMMDRRRRWVNKPDSI
jgi:hypothetical protein